MKKLLFLILAGSLPAASVTISFDGNNPTSSVEYVAQELQPDGTWKESVSGPASPLSISNLPFGPHTFRIMARLPGNNSVTSGSSNEVSATLVAAVGTPSNAKIIVIVIDESKVP